MSEADDVNAVRGLVARYAQVFDAGDAEGWASLFVEDGAVIVDDNPPVRGRPALTQFLLGIETGSMRHFAVNEVISVNGDTAACRSSMFVTRGTPPSVITTGFYEDEFVRKDSEWRFNRRVLRSDR